MFPKSRLLAISTVLFLSPLMAVAQYGGAAVAALNGEDAGIVKNQPCIWVQRIAITTHGPDGTTITRYRTERKWRDANGRFRREIATTTEGQEPVFQIATILDPVKNTITTLHMDTKIANVVHMPSGTLHSYVDADEREMLAAPGVQIKVEQLKKKEIMGVSVVGRRVTRTRPPGSIGNNKTIVSVNERWDAPDLKIMMWRTLDDPRQGEHSEVTELKRVEPDAALFQVPSDYAMNEAQGGALHQVIVPGH
jgi:hypothetical protein